MRFNEQLAALRRERGISQESLAEKVGVSRQAISKWETGTAQPEMSNIMKLCEVLDVSPDTLLRSAQASGSGVSKRETEPLRAEKSGTPACEAPERATSDYEVTEYEIPDPERTEDEMPEAGDREEDSVREAVGRIGQKIKNNTAAVLITGIMIGFFIGWLLGSCLSIQPGAPSSTGNGISNISGANPQVSDLKLEIDGYRLSPTGSDTDKAKTMGVVFVPCVSGDGWKFSVMVTEVETGRSEIYEAEAENGLCNARIMVPCPYYGSVVITLCAERDGQIYSVMVQELYDIKKNGYSWDMLYKEG